MSTVYLPADRGSSRRGGVNFFFSTSTYFSDSGLSETFARFVFQVLVEKGGYDREVRENIHNTL